MTRRAGRRTPTTAQLAAHLAALAPDAAAGSKAINEVMPLQLALRRACVICKKSLPAGALLTCSTRCARQAREQEAMHGAYRDHGADRRPRGAEIATPADLNSAALEAD